MEMTETEKKVFLEYIIDQDEIFFLVKIMKNKFDWPERRVRDCLNDLCNKGILRVSRYNLENESYHDAELSEIDWRNLDEQHLISLVPTRAAFAMYDELFANDIKK